MTYDIETLRTLEKRLSEAAADRGLDEDIDAALNKGNVTGCAAPFTASLDAAIALCERVLWGRGLFLAKGRCRPSEPLWGAQILASDENYEQREMPVIAEAEADTAALALCLATVRALIAEATR